MLVDNFSERSAPLRKHLLDSGCEVVGQLSSTADLNRAVAELAPDVVIVDTESPSRDTLENICAVCRDEPRPIVMFTHDGDTEKIRAATKAGVSAYVVGGLDTNRLRPIIEAAIARFEEFRGLREQLDVANTKLSERKLIERAKGLLMERRSLNEEQAYQLLRSEAMQQHMKLAELAGRLIQAADLL
jgi:response regulator NasT